MISLADDSYIEEMFTTRLYERKHHGAAWIAAAAAVAAVAVGAAGIALNSANSDKIITDIQDILTETETDTSALESAATDRTEGDYTDCEKYFTNELDEEIAKQFWRDALYEYDYGEYDSYICGSLYDFSRDYIDEITRFDTSSYDFCTANMFCGKNDTPRRANITLIHNSDNSDFTSSTMINMVFYTDDSGLAKYFKEEQYVPVIRNGVELYGFDLSENKDGSSLLAHWKVNETNYVFSFTRIGCEKSLEIIDQYLTGDFTLDSFDLNISGITKHSMDYISPAEMNRNSVFAGYIPEYPSFAELLIDEEAPLNYDDYSSDGEIFYRRYYYYYIFGDPESYENGNAENYIYLIYEWGTYNNSLESEILPIIPFEEITPDRLDEIRKDMEYSPDYQFVIPINDFTITVFAECEREQLLEAINAIRNQGTNGNAEEMVMYHGREYRRSDLSEETLEWLDWYNSASKEEQDSVSYVPSELLTFLEYWF